MGLVCFVLTSYLNIMRICGLGFANVCYVSVERLNHVVYFMVRYEE